MDNFEVINQHISELMNLPQLTEKERLYLYNLATNKCKSGDFIGAIALFQFLVLAERSNKLYIKALAGSMHGAKQYSEALELYQMVYLIDIEHEYDCLFFSADCLFNMGDYIMAKDNLEKFVSIAIKKKPQNEFILKRANLLLAGIPK